MPILVNAHYPKDQKKHGTYIFPEEHRKGWEEFWQANDGDVEKIIKFAETAEIEYPGEWADSLYVYLFGTFWGNPKLLIQAASKSFGGFLDQVAKNHENNPKPKDWYYQHGVTKDQFVTAIKNAADINDLDHCIAYVNARMANLGYYLYSEFLLSKTKNKAELKSIASDMNEEAFELESSIFDPEAIMKSGNKVQHLFYKDMEFTIESYEPTNQIVTAKDTNQKTVYFTDIWNLRVL